MAKTDTAEQKLKYLNIGLPSDLHLAFKTKCVGNGQYVGDTLTALMSMYCAGQCDPAEYLQKKQKKDV
jgi:hypothetical protein